MINSLARRSAACAIDNFLNEQSSTAGFCYLRGRRRVGKSTLLKQLQSEYPTRMFYFMGRPDERSGKALQRCIESWSIFSGTRDLSRLKSSEVTWDDFFRAVSAFGKMQEAPILLAFDEIQWIAREKSGFLGALKEHWISLEPVCMLRFLICGSSNRFFHEMTGGEEKLVRGLKTRSDIWLLPLTLSEIRQHYQPRYSDEELLLSYLFLGGIPYYWNQIDCSLFFIQAFNDACFRPASIFLEEYREILNVEFQKNSVQTLTSLLSHIKGSGVTASYLSRESGLSHSTVGDILEKLLNFGLIFRKTAMFAPPKEIHRGALFYLKDFYLNFYFRVMAKCRGKISRNRSGAQIFGDILNGKSRQLYLEDFTGPMFEVLVEHVLENDSERKIALFQKLRLADDDFEIGYHWDKSAQFDLILHKTADRVLRVIECKWTRDTAQIIRCISTFQERVSAIQSSSQKLLCLNHNPNKTVVAAAKKYQVELILPSDLIG